MCVRMCVQSCSTLQPHGHGIFQARILEWVGIRIFQRVFQTQGSKPRLPWQKDSLSTAPPEKSRSTYLHTYLQFTCFNQDINNVHLFHLVDVSLSLISLPSIFNSHPGKLLLKEPGHLSSGMSHTLDFDGHILMITFSFILDASCKL